MRDDPRDSSGGAGTGGQDSECPDGAGRSLHPRGVGERQLDTNHRTPPVGAHPSPAAALPDRRRRSDVAPPGRRARRRWMPRAGGSGARRGRCVPRAGPPEPSGGGGRRRERGRRGLLQCCNAAPRRARRPGRAPPPVTAAMRMEAPPGLGRTGPGIPCLLGPHPAPDAPGCRSPPLPWPRFVFLLPPPGTAGRFLLRRDAAGLCPRDRPLALCLGTGRGPHPAPGAERRRTPPAATLVAPSSTPASLCGSPRRRDFEAPGAPPTRGGSLVSALLRSSFPGRISSLPILRASHRLCFPVSFSLSPLTPLRSPAQTGWTLRSPRRGGGPTSASLPRGCHQALGIAAPGTGEPPLPPRGARVR